MYRTEGTQAFINYQREHEDVIVKPGVAFRLVEALLGLNKRLGTPEKPAIEIVIMSKNHPDCAIRIHRSLRHYGINVSGVVDVSLSEDVFIEGLPVNKSTLQVDNNFTTTLIPGRDYLNGFVEPVSQGHYYNGTPSTLLWTTGPQSGINNCLSEVDIYLLAESYPQNHNDYIATYQNSNTFVSALLAFTTILLPPDELASLLTVDLVLSLDPRYVGWNNWIYLPTWPY